MADISPAPKTIDREDVGAPVEAHGHTLWPTARVRGWQAFGADRDGGGGGALLHVSPVDVRVRRPDGTEAVVAVTDPTGEAIRGMAMAAGAVVVASIVTALVAAVAAARRGRRSDPETGTKDERP